MFSHQGRTPNVGTSRVLGSASKVGGQFRQSSGIPAPGGAVGGSHRGAYYGPPQTDSGMRVAGSRRGTPAPQAVATQAEARPIKSEQGIPLPPEWTSSMRELYTIQHGEYEAVGESGVVESRVIENIIVEKDVDTFLGGAEQDAEETPGQTEVDYDSQGAAGYAAKPSSAGARALSPVAESPRAVRASPRGATVEPSHAHSSPLGRPPRSTEQLQQRSIARDASPGQPQISQRMVSPPLMESPVGLIESQQEFVLERRTEANARKVMVDTRITGTNTVEPGQSQQIEVLKKDIYMPEPPYRSPSASPRPARSPPLRSALAVTPQKGAPCPAKIRDSPARPFGTTMARGGPTPTKRSPPKPVGVSGLSAPSRVCAKEIYGECTDLDTVKRMIDEENNDIDETIQLIKMSPSSLCTQRKLKVLRNKSRSLRLLEESLTQCLPHDDQGGAMQSDLVAALMYSEESGIPVRTPPQSKRSYHNVMEQSGQGSPGINVSSVAPSPMQDVVVPTGRPSPNLHNYAFQDISSSIREGRSLESRSVVSSRMPGMENDVDVELLRRERKMRDQNIVSHTSNPAKSPKHSSRDPYYDLDAEVSPWEDEFDVKGAVGGMAALAAGAATDSEESLDTQHLDYILEYEPPKHYSRAQLRGSTHPSWFPGFYSVFPGVPDLVALEKRPSRVFRVAWNTFRPDTVLENSEVVIV